MNNKEVHILTMKKDLTREYQIFKKFWNILGLIEENKYETIILLDGEAIEDALEWPGISQTIKKFIIKENIEMKEEIAKLE